MRDFDKLCLRKALSERYIEDYNFGDVSGLEKVNIQVKLGEVEDTKSVEKVLEHLIWVEKITGRKIGLKEKSAEGWDRKDSSVKLYVTLRKGSGYNFCNIWKEIVKAYLSKEKLLELRMEGHGKGTSVGILEDPWCFPKLELSWSGDKTEVLVTIHSKYTEKEILNSWLVGLGWCKS